MHANRYFHQSKLTSFQQQLNLYGFHWLTRGPDGKSYYNEYFLRGLPALTRRIAQIKVKGTGIKAASSPDQEPQLYLLPTVAVVLDKSENDISLGLTMTTTLAAVDDDFDIAAARNSLLFPKSVEVPVQDIDLAIGEAINKPSDSKFVDPSTSSDPPFTNFKRCNPTTFRSSMPSWKMIGCWVSWWNSCLKHDWNQRISIKKYTILQ